MTDWQSEWVSLWQLCNCSACERLLKSQQNYNFIVSAKTFYFTYYSFVFIYLDAIGSASYIVIDTDYDTYGILCTCQVFHFIITNYNYILNVVSSYFSFLPYFCASYFPTKQGPQGAQKLNSLKSLKIHPTFQLTNTGMCHKIIRNGFFVKI